MYSMILLYDAVSVIQSEFPYLSYQTRNSSNNKNLFHVVNNLANYTKNQLLENNEAECEHCFKVAYEIWEQGSNISKMAIENIFVYSLSRLLERSFSVSNEHGNNFLNFSENNMRCKLGVNTLNKLL